MTLPNFLIIGANKAGTTSLYNYLKQHPEIYMSPAKEPMFFTSEGTQRDLNLPGHEIVLKDVATTLDEYQALFQGVTDEKAIGEASTAYLHNPGCATRIRYYVPNMKCIAILRDPVERAYSNYLMYVTWGLEKLTFEQAVEAENSRMQENYPHGWYYVQLGFYYEPVHHFFEVFGKQQVKVYLYEDFQTKPFQVLRDIFDYLGVEQTFVPDMSLQHNVSLVPKHRRWHNFITTPHVLKAIFKPFIPAIIRRKIVERLKRQNLGKPPLSSETRKNLIEIYKPDILKLQDLIQRDLSKWLE